MASYKENKQFLSSVINENLLDEAINWIKSNMNPDDVFDEDQLEEWAKDNGFVESEE